MEQFFADLDDGSLAHRQSGRFNASAAWFATARIGAIGRGAGDHYGDALPGEMPAVSSFAPEH